MKNQKLIFTVTNPYFEMIGYEPKTTFWSDFTIAERFGLSGVKDTYDRSIKSWKEDIVYMTELSMVLNHKGWIYHEANEELSKYYFNLYNEIDNLIFQLFEDGSDEIHYYIQTTD